MPWWFVLGKVCFSLVQQRKSKRFCGEMDRCNVYFRSDKTLGLAFLLLYSKATHHGITKGLNAADGRRAFLGRFSDFGNSA